MKRSTKHHFKPRHKTDVTHFINVPIYVMNHYHPPSYHIASQSIFIAYVFSFYCTGWRYHVISSDTLAFISVYNCFYVISLLAWLTYMMHNVGFFNSRGWDSMHTNITLKSNTFYCATIWFLSINALCSKNQQLQLRLNMKECCTWGVWTMVDVLSTIVTCVCTRARVSYSVTTAPFSKSTSVLWCMIIW